MNFYNVPLKSETLEVLQCLKGGFKAVSVTKSLPTDAWPNACYLELWNGSFVKLSASEVGLEYKFEVFLLLAEIKSEVNTSDRIEMICTSPVLVLPLQTDSWLDPAAPTGETVGMNPIAQFTGAPCTVPSTASACCRYVGAVELKGANGLQLIIATGCFPYSMHVPGFFEDPYFYRGDYIPYLG